MIEINESSEIRNQLKSQGSITILDKPENIAATATMNEQMEAVRREFQVKDRKSQMSASLLILTD